MSTKKLFKDNKFIIKYIHIQVYINLLKMVKTFVKGLKKSKSIETLIIN